MSTGTRPADVGAEDTAAAVTAAAGLPVNGTLEQASEVAAVAAATGAVQVGRKRGRTVAGVEAGGTATEAVTEAEAPATRPARRAKLLANAAISASGAAGSRGRGQSAGRRRTASGAQADWGGADDGGKGGRGGADGRTSAPAPRGDSKLPAKERGSDAAARSDAEMGAVAVAVESTDGDLGGAAATGVKAPARGRVTRGSSRNVGQPRSTEHDDSKADGGVEAAPVVAEDRQGVRAPRRASQQRSRPATAAAEDGDSAHHRGVGGGDDGDKPQAKLPSKPRRKGRQEAPATAVGVAAVAAGQGAAAEGDAGQAAAAVPAARRGKKAAATAPPAAPRLVVLSPEAAEALRGEPLLDLGQLVPGTLVRRPSASIKTPYVADVRLVLPEQDGGDDVAFAGSSSGPMVLAHAPALDCAGMVTPGATVYLSDSAATRREGAPPTATSHAIQLVEDLRPGGEVAVVGSHPQLAERMAAEMLRRRCLEGVLGPYDAIETQRTYGNTRVDFVLRMADGSSTLLEVKNVVCADFPAGGVPPGRPKLGAYTVPVPPDGSYRPTALFPHGAQKPKIKVVSDRAIKHVWELTQLHKEGATRLTPAPTPDEDSSGQPPPPPPPAAAGQAKLRCAVLFVVNRSDCVAFRPCHEADPLFAQVLRAAQDAGVTLLAYDITWRGGQALLGKQLPVEFGEGVTGQYDPGRLAEVLEFNATDPRKNRKPGGSGGGSSPKARKNKEG